MNRTEVLNLVAKITGARSYLEIGVFDPRVNFDRIQCSDKLGVDPSVDAPRVVKTTSDCFFAALDSDRRWDLIFIDGDHRWEQVERDFVNALRFLSPSGVIAMHDVDPESEAAASATKPSPNAIWSGEAWKVLVTRARTRRDLRCVTVDCDHGVGLVTRGRSPATLESVPAERALTFSWLRQNRLRALGLIPAEPIAIRKFFSRASIAYYTSNQAQRSLRRECFRLLRENATGHELIVVAQRSEDFFDAADQLEIISDPEFSLENLYYQMLRGLERAGNDTVFLAEDDVLYPDGYFEFQLPSRFRFYYNMHGYVANLQGFFAYEYRLTSNVAGDRDLLTHAVRQRLQFVRAGGTIGWAEPGRGGHDDFSSEVYRSKVPTVDIRHGLNLTGYREVDTYLDRIDYWGRHDDLMTTLGLSEAPRP